MFLQLHFGVGGEFNIHLRQFCEMLKENREILIYIHTSKTKSYQSLTMCQPYILDQTWMLWTGAHYLREERHQVKGVFIITAKFIPSLCCVMEVYTDRISDNTTYKNVISDLWLFVAYVLEGKVPMIYFLKRKNLLLLFWGWHLVEMDHNRLLSVSPP